MKRYEAYKPSGTAWFTSVPEPWNILKINALFSQRKEKVSDKDFAPISVTKNGIMPQLETAAKTDDGDNRKKVCVGDFVINSRSDRKGSCGVSSFDGSVSLINIVLQPRQELNGRYAHYLLRSQPFSEEFYRNGRGIVADLWTTRYSEMKNILLPVPPRDKQDQIVRYLDWQVSKINRLIAAKQKQIELTREYALAKIEDVFNTTIGTDSDNIPIGRHIRKIESGTSVNSIIGTADKETPGVLSTSCVYGNHFDASQNKRVEPADYERVSCPVRKNTVIVSRMNTPALVGACGFSDKDIDNVFLPDRLWQVYFDDTLMPEFVWRYLSRPRAQAWFATIATGSSNTMKNITKPQFKAVLIPNVPSDMQRRIIKSISKITDERDTACQLYEQTISTLQALRTRLISDVVTGQIDVRGIEVPNYEHYDEAPENATEESSDSDYDTEE